VSRLVPIRVVEDYFGFKGPDLATMFRWSRATQADMFHNQKDDPQVHQDNLQAGAEMAACVRELISTRRREIAGGAGGDTALDRMLETRLPAEVGFDEERLLVNTCGFLIGAGETTSAAIVQILDQLLEHPEWMSAARSAAVAGEQSRLAAVCWEALRFNPINPFVVRTCARDAVIGSGRRRTRVKEGAKVLACTRSAMWDAKVMESPREFRPGRPSEDYLHFGFGHHTCLGDQVSSVVIPETVRALVRLPGLRRDKGPEGRPDFAGGPFPESFTVRFDPA
jgi:cytochrome P450